MEKEANNWILIIFNDLLNGTERKEHEKRSKG